MRRLGVIIAACLFLPVSAGAQSWTTPRTWITGEQVTKAIMDAHIRDNEIVLRAGGIAVASQGANEIIYATSSTQFGRSALFTFDGTVFTVGGFGAHAFSAGGAGANTLGLRNTTAGTGNYVSLNLGNDSSASLGFLQAYSSTFTSNPISLADGVLLGAGGAGGLSIYTSAAAGAIRFYTNATQRWGINAAGDWTGGSAGHIADSLGTPSLHAGWTAPAAISGVDYAFRIAGAAGDLVGTVDFGHSWTTAPVCVANQSSGTEALRVSTTTTSVNFVTASGISGNVQVLCRGF